MKPIDNTENFVKRGKAKVTTDAQMDKRVLADSFAAMDEAAAGRSSPARMILRSKVARLAAAVAIITAIGLLIIPSDKSEQASRPNKHVAKPPAEMLSAMSLNMAYRRGGIEAVDDVSNEAFKALGSKPANVSVRELLTGLNGV